MMVAISYHYLVLVVLACKSSFAAPQNNANDRHLHLLRRQYTGATVAGTPGLKPTQWYTLSEANRIMEENGNGAPPPSDIANVRAKGWVRGKILGQSINAQGNAQLTVGNNNMGGITAVGDAQGQILTQGPAGTFAAQGQARAGLVTASSSLPNGGQVYSGAAAVRASGSFYAQSPSGRRVYGSGGAGAYAYGSMETYPK